MEPNDCHTRISELNRLQFVVLCVGPHFCHDEMKGQRGKPETLPPTGFLLTNSQTAQLRWLLHATVVQKVLLICG
jgi:hypothetical protein